MARFDRDGKTEKPKKRRRASQDRFAFHMCYHGDAWLGVDELSCLAAGVYWKLILRMYIKRAALLDDDADLARLFNEDLRSYRRAKAELLRHGRVVVADGLIYDERAFRELVGLERYSDVQAERAKARWKEKAENKKPPLRVVDNIAPLDASSAEVLRQVGAISTSPRVVSPPASVENVEESGCRAHANPTSNIHTTEGEAHRRAAGRRLAADGGGAPTDRKAWLEVQRAALGLTEAGKDEGGTVEQRDPPTTTQQPEQPAADRKAVRT